MALAITFYTSKPTNKLEPLFSLLFCLTPWVCIIWGSAITFIFFHWAVQLREKSMVDGVKRSAFEFWLSHSLIFQGKTKSMVEYGGGSWVRARTEACSVPESPRMALTRWIHHSHHFTSWDMWIQTYTLLVQYTLLELLRWLLKKRKRTRTANV